MVPLQSASKSDTFDPNNGLCTLLRHSLRFLMRCVFLLCQKSTSQKITKKSSQDASLAGIVCQGLYSGEACQSLTQIARGPQSCLSTHRQICYLALGLQLYRLQTTADEPAVRPAIGRRSARNLAADRKVPASSPAVQPPVENQRWIHGLIILCINPLSIFVHGQSAHLNSTITLMVLFTTEFFGILQSPSYHPLYGNY